MAEGSERKPEEIRQEVYSQLVWDTRVNASDIDVEVKDGKVILKGLVPSYLDVWEAEDDAYAIEGVRYVENRLKVSPPPHFPVPGDPEIASKVRSLLEWNPNIDARGIDISVDRGLVTLMGTVESIWQKHSAGRIAEDVAGVVGVNNEISVEPSVAVTDEDIRTDIIGTLVRNSFIDAGMVNVHVKHCVVTLSGTVHDYYAYRTAEEISRSTQGVKDVNNNLVIA
ncbi:MAG TPA: BON domain-containing protein [Deltaproteobacteria bacterium]|jgi:osmotically-inducible protein OsmY|nr:BON domain-containing protein [Deltaproteobacteria bacterium]HOI05643.1 BON domain-containing protein [Deltaproteobacteria bacterium]